MDSILNEPKSSMNHDYGSVIHKDYEHHDSIRELDGPGDLSVFDDIKT